MSKLYNEEPSYGFSHPDYNWLLSSVLDANVISRLPLKCFHIDYYMRTDKSKLNWEILSARYLDGWIFVKYQDLINWEAFILNGKPKELLYLIEIKHILLKYNYLFFRDEVKKMYYNIAFISAFPEIIDWRWCSKYVELNDYIIRKYWSKIPVDTLCKYQTLTDNILQEKKYNLNWSYICKNPLSDYLIEKYKELVDWAIICKHQKISDDILKKCISFIKENKKSVKNICKYQILKESFIEDNKWLDRENVLQYQNLSVEFIKRNADYIDLEILCKNNNYNKPGCVQIIKHIHKDKLYWYIIDAPYIDAPYIDAPYILYCDINN
jgi:hypothetical protein